jgi:hypothetical protein
VSESLTERLNLAVSTDLIREIDDWRRLQPEIPSRAEAARLLIKRGIEADKPKGPGPTGDPSKSARRR